MSTFRLPLNARTFFVTLLGILFYAGSFIACVAPEASLADKKNYTENDDQYKRKYNIEYEADEKPLRYGYHYVVSNIPQGYKVRVFHPDKHVLTEEKIYSTEALTLLHGSYNSYWDDGYIRAQGHYLLEENMALGWNVNPARVNHPPVHI